MKKDCAKSTPSCGGSDHDVEQGLDDDQHDLSGVTNSLEKGQIRHYAIPRRQSTFSDHETTYDEANNEDAASSDTSNSTTGQLAQRKTSIGAFIIFVGAVASAAFLSLGIVGANKEQELLFSNLATEFSNAMEETFKDYEIFGLWIHESCHASPFRTKQATKMSPLLENYNASTAALDADLASYSLGICSREEFRELYEYVKSVGLNFQSAQYMPNVTQENRALLEQEAKAYYQEFYPHVNYRGITGLFPKEGGGMTVDPQNEHPFYFPVHYVEPVLGNEAAIELDLYSSPTQRKTIESAMTNWKPALTDRLRLVQETQESQSIYGVILHHPGVPLSTRPELESPEGSALMVIRIPDLLERAATEHSSGNKVVYLYDVTYSDPDNEGKEGYSAPIFLGATQIFSNEDGVQKETHLPEVDISTIKQSFDAPFNRRMERRDMTIADRKWTVVVVSLDGAYDPNLIFIVLGGCIIFMASVLLCVWFFSHMHRIAKMNQVKRDNEAEKSAIIVDTARRQALAERQLNEYIAHEVRNPLSSAIAALSFVAAATQESNKVKPLGRTASSLLADDSATNSTSIDGSRIFDRQPSLDAAEKSLQDDLAIIDSSLQFINDLLRNMLDMNRAASHQMDIEMARIDLMSDVLQPVAAVLFLRGNKVEVLVECPPDLEIISDRLRLKQIILNLAINSSKFVEQGYIRIGARIVTSQRTDSTTSKKKKKVVQVFVEDSGPGVPVEKRDRLFVKFQESLDLLNQGTGIGLCLCKHLVELMHGDIWLDETFDSGIPNFPGSRFIIDLNASPLSDDGMDTSSMPGSSRMPSGLSTDDSTTERTESSSSMAASKTAATKDVNQGAEASQEPEVHHEHCDHHHMMKQNPNDHDKEQRPPLPESLSVLFVDDDLVLRKLFSRSLRRVAPSWQIQEAANGESALHLIESQTFDLIFLDQFMASINKQLLGSETARALRAKGVTSKICGLSANDVESQFKESGADAFMFKPFPCQEGPLREELIRVLYGDEQQQLHHPRTPPSPPSMSS